MVKDDVIFNMPLIEQNLKFFHHPIVSRCDYDNPDKAEKTLGFSNIVLAMQKNLRDLIFLI